MKTKTTDGEKIIEIMRRTGRANLFLSYDYTPYPPRGMLDSNGHAIDSNGMSNIRIESGDNSLVIQPGQGRVGGHNVCGTRYDTWFVGPDGYTWHGVQMGDNCIIRCKRTKERGSDGRYNSIIKGWKWDGAK